MLPKKNTSPIALPLMVPNVLARPVLALAFTCTSSQRLAMAPLAQTISTRSDPPAPPPMETCTLSGAGAAAQLCGLLALAPLVSLMRNTKSPAEMAA